MGKYRGLTDFLQHEKSERGAMMIMQAIFLLATIFIAALVVDGGNLYVQRRILQKTADIACINAAIGLNLGQDAATVAADTVLAHDISEEYFTPKEGEGIGLLRGIEVSDDGEYIRVALYGPVQTYFIQFVPGLGDNLEMGAKAHCKKGIGGPAPLVLEEKTDEDDLVFETKKPNDHWTGGPCPNQMAAPNPDPAERDPAYCWVWGVDIQMLAGDGHTANEGTVSMNGLVAPDVRCEGAPSESNMCPSKVYIPPATEGAVNPLKGLTQSYMCGGYNGYEPIPGTFSGVHSANVAQLEGVSNAQLSKAVTDCYGFGDLIVAWVYAGGVVWDADKNYDYVEIIGLVVARIVYVDANSVGVIPVYPVHNAGDPNTLRDDLPKTVAELETAGYNVKPILVEWEL